MCDEEAKDAGQSHWDANVVNDGNVLVVVVVVVVVAVVVMVVVVFW